MTTAAGSATSADQIRALIDDRVRAVAAKGVEATMGLQKTDGVWVITHEHNSVPFDAESGKASLDLAP